jgi:hypothetical protein
MPIQLVLETNQVRSCDIKRLISCARGKRERHPFTGIVSNHKLIGGDTLRYEKDVQLGKRGDEEREQREGGQQQQGETPSYRLQRSDRSLVLLGAGATIAAILAVTRSIWLGRWTFSPGLETLRRRRFVASRFPPILIPSSFEVLYGTGFVQVRSKTSSEIMHCTLAIVCLDQSLQIIQIGKGKSIKQVVQQGKYIRIDHVHWSRREFWICHVLFRGEPGPRVRCQLLSQFKYAEMLRTS